MYCCSLSLFGYIVNIYLEWINHIVIRGGCANDGDYTENNKQCQECKYRYKKFVSAPAWSSFNTLIVSVESHCLVTSLLVWCTSNLLEKQLPSALNKTPYFHTHISVSDFVIPL